MPFISLKEELPGVTGLLDYRKDTALPIRELTHTLLRGESTLTEGERELIAAVVSNGNECKFCTAAHTATADLLLGNKEITEKAKYNLENAPVTDKMKALLTIAKAVQRNGNEVTEEMVEEAKTHGATERELHDTVLITALFCLYNRYVDGLATVTPSAPEFYDRLGHILVDKGYLPSEGRYDSLQEK